MDDFSSSTFSTFIETSSSIIISKNFIRERFMKHLSFDEFKSKTDIILCDIDSIETINSDAFDDFENLTILRMNGNGLKNFNVN
jgi:hypothetical protein